MRWWILPRAAAALALAAGACSSTVPQTPVALAVAAPVPPPALAGAPLLALLDRFTTDVPVLGPVEAGATPRTWPEPKSAPAWPGKGLAQHPMLFAGEGYNTIFLVRDGKVVWTYSTGRGGEIDDVWMLSNGHVLYARQHHVEEVTPQKELVWHYEAPPGTEVHSCQPLGLDRVLLVQNGLPPKAMIIDKPTRKVVLEHALPAQSLTDQRTVHAQFRRIRMTAQGTFLVPFLKLGKVVEYDRNWVAVWTHEIPTPWSAVRLRNGNTLIANERERLVREVSPRGETVWQVSQADLPPEIVLRNIQTAERLANGNTVVFSSTGGVRREDRPSIIQAVEVTPDKKVVWVLQDWKNLGPATTAQFLDQPGIPENPGELQH